MKADAIATFDLVTSGFPPAEPNRRISVPVANSPRMRVIALFLSLAAAACGSAAPSPGPGTGGIGGGAAGASGGTGGAAYASCPQHRVEAPECPSATAADGVLRKDGLICASCSGFDASGNPTAKPVDCLTVAGGDLCVADCGECS